MPLRTGLTDLLGIEKPVLGAPMAAVSGPGLAGAVSAAGGLGGLGSAVIPPTELTGRAAAIRELTDRPFNMNFFCHSEVEVREADAVAAHDRFAPLFDELGLGEPPAPAVPPIRFGDAHLAALLEIRPAVVSFHFGLPDPSAVDALHESGCLILSSATTVEEAVELAGRGADAVIAQGAEAGGHRGSFLVSGDDGPVGTLALVPQVVDSVDVPVIAAGGIADGRGLAAALALGAGGAQVGTALLRCPEADVPPLYLEALAGARAEGTVITRAFSGRPARALRNRATTELGRPPLPFPAQLSLSAPLGAAAAERGSSELLAMWAGQAAPLAEAVGAADLIERVCADAERILGR
jgi:nitronate monooxygenase